MSGELVYSCIIGNSLVAYKHVAKNLLGVKKVSKVHDEKLNPIRVNIDDNVPLSNKLGSIFPAASSS